MAKGDYLTSKQAAKLISFSYHTMLLLEDMGKGPPTRGSDARPYERGDVFTYQAYLPDNLNELLGKGLKPIFAEDDYGMWRPIVTYSEASGMGERRYFDGRPCGAGHVADRFTKNQRCTICSEIRAGRR